MTSGRQLSTAAAGFAAASLLLAACASSPGAGDWDEGIVVEFSYSSLSPQTVQIPAGGNVRWVNIADDAMGIVVLPAGIAKSFRCDDLQPYFHETEAGWESLPITGSVSNRVELPCALAPGSYAYEIWMVGASAYEAKSVQQKLHGTIVVE